MEEYIFRWVYGKNLYAISLWMILLIVVWSIVTVRIRRKDCWKWLNRILAFAMVVIIVGLTIGSRVPGEYQGKVFLRPFYSFEEARVNPERYRSMFMNVFLFFPLGLAMPYGWGHSLKGKLWFTILFSAFLSVAIEFIQFYFRLGRCELDDVIMNTLGAVIGSSSYVIYYIYYKNKMEEDHR